MKILHATSKILTFVDPITNDPYADVAVRTAGSYRNPIRNAIRQLPKQVRKPGVKGKRKARSAAAAALRRVQ